MGNFILKLPMGGPQKSGKVELEIVLGSVVPTLDQTWVVALPGLHGWLGKVGPPMPASTPIVPTHSGADCGWDMPAVPSVHFLTSPTWSLSNPGAVTLSDPGTMWRLGMDGAWCFASAWQSIGAQGGLTGLNWKNTHILILTYRPVCPRTMS